jgi:hypothetical protein
MWEVIVQQPRPHERPAFGVGACLWYVPVRLSRQGAAILWEWCLDRSVKDGPNRHSNIQHLFSPERRLLPRRSGWLARRRRLARSRTPSQLCLPAYMSLLHTVYQSTVQRKNQMWTFVARLWFDKNADGFCGNEVQSIFLSRTMQ